MNNHGSSRLDFISGTANAPARPLPSIIRFKKLLFCLALLPIVVGALRPAEAQAPASTSIDQSISQPSSQTQAADAAPSDASPAPAPLTSDQLDALVAPIALYPDALVAQVVAMTAGSAVTQSGEAASHSGRRGAETGCQRRKC